MLNSTTLTDDPVSSTLHDRRFALQPSMVEALGRLREQQQQQQENAIDFTERISLAFAALRVLSFSHVLAGVCNFWGRGTISCM